MQALSPTYIEGEVVDALIAELEAIGVPYDAVYTAAVDSQKAADATAYSDALSSWESTAGSSHRTCKLACGVSS